MKVLIATDKYYPRALANAICAQALGESFAAAGHQVEMLIFKDSGIEPPKTWNGLKVHSIRPDLRHRLFYFKENFPSHRYARLAGRTASVLSKTKKLLLLPFEPLSSLRFPYRIMRKMEDLDAQMHYDLIISVFVPFETLLAGKWFKKRHPDRKWCIYLLDSTLLLHEEWKWRPKLPKKLRHMGFWLPRLFEAADAIVYMRSRISEFAGSRFDPWRGKMYVSDIPLMQAAASLTAPAPTPAKAHTENWVYAGTLSRAHYDPTDAIACFLALPADKQRVFHIYSRRAGWEELQKQYAGDARIQFHDYVPHEELVEIYKKADILVSVKNSDLISAKIFEYMSFNKRIVHFSGSPNDPNLYYITQYANGAGVISYEGTLEQRVQKLYEKLQQWDREPIPPQADLSPFEMNRPAYTRDLILRAVGAAPPR